nr:tol-Pal system protein TolA-like [Aegilops tauschii subsp. strangulata]
MPPRGVSSTRVPSTEPTRTEEEEVNLGGSGSIPATNIGGEGTTSSQLGADPSSGDQENVDTVIEEVAKNAEAEADKIAAEETAKTATEEAAKGPAGEADKTVAEEAGKAATREAGKGPAGEEGADDQPSSPTAPAPGMYLKALHCACLDKAKSGMAAVDKAEADLEERVAQTQAWFREAQKGLKAAHNELAECKRELILKQVDVKKAQEAANEQAAKDAAARQQHQALLNSQEEELAAREEALTATLRGQDEEVEKVKELELEREELKKVVLELTRERDTANRSLADAQAAVSDKAKQLS